MMNLNLIITVFFSIILSCNTTKNENAIENLSVYENVIKDIKSSKDFNQFSKRRNILCSNFYVQKYDYSICGFGQMFKDEKFNQDYKEICDEDYDLVKYDSSISNLDKFSDKGENCFIIYFSEIVNNRILVEVISKDDESKSGHESLYYLYLIEESNNKVKLIESIKVIHE
jgi:hypothetical protein